MGDGAGAGILDRDSVSGDVIIGSRRGIGATL
jgi:hypothetical protein